MDIDERFTKLHGILELVETCREVIEHCHGDADETFTHPITYYLLAQQQKIEQLEADLLEAYNIIEENCEFPINDLLTEECKSYNIKAAKVLSKAEQYIVDILRG